VRAPATIRPVERHPKLRRGEASILGSAGADEQSGNFRDSRRTLAGFGKKKNHEKRP
jgi:hypothetical protein